MNLRPTHPDETSLQKLADKLVDELKPNPVTPVIRNKIEFTESDLFVQLVLTSKKQAKHYLAAQTALIEFLPDD